MSVRATRVSILFAAYLLVLPDANVSGAVTRIVLATYVVAPLTIGAVGGWRALPTFTATYLVTSIAYQLLVWPDDPRLTGIDDIPPVAGIVLVVPLMLLPMAIGVGLRRRWLERRTRQAQRRLR